MGMGHHSFTTCALPHCSVRLPPRQLSTYARTHARTRPSKLGRTDPSLARILTPRKHPTKTKCCAPSQTSTMPCHTIPYHIIPYVNKRRQKATHHVGEDGAPAPAHHAVILTLHKRLLAPLNPRTAALQYTTAPGSQAEAANHHPQTATGTPSPQVKQYTTASCITQQSLVEVHGDRNGQSQSRGGTLV